MNQATAAINEWIRINKIPETLYRFIQAEESVARIIVECVPSIALQLKTLLGEDICEGIRACNLHQVGPLGQDGQFQSDGRTMTFIR